MLASLAGGLSLAAIDAYDARQGRDAEATAREEASAVERSRVQGDLARDAFAEWCRRTKVCVDAKRDRTR
jgi:hypothetical protein